jgi:E3 ubiquitin-protein ligase TRIP12
LYHQSSPFSDGSKVEAKTPQGTRVATPNPLAQQRPNLGSPSTSRTASYAAALKAKPVDWHLEFSIDDRPIALDTTIYGAFYQHEVRKAAGSPILPSQIWSGMYTVKFKKVLGPAPAPEGLCSHCRVSSHLTFIIAKPVFLEALQPEASFTALPEDNVCTKILRLLRILFKLNSRAADSPSKDIQHGSLPQTSFINNKLTAKLIRQLEETMIVASSCLPEWALELPQQYPFLFPFSTRYSFLQSTSFGYARLIVKWQHQHERDRDRRDDGFGHLGRLQRQKVRISRKHLLESAIKVFELYGSSSSVLEVEYFEEVGTGLGPTLEFYSLVSKEFLRRDLKLWRDADTTFPGDYVFHPHGLFPAPASDGNAEIRQYVWFFY